MEKKSRLARHGQTSDEHVLAIRLIGAPGTDRQAPAKILAPTILRLITAQEKTPSSSPIKSAPTAEPPAGELSPDTLPILPPSAQPLLSSLLSDPADIRSGDALDVADFFPSAMVTVSAIALTDVDLDAVVRDDALPPSELELTLLIDEQGIVVDVIAGPFQIPAELALAKKIGTVFKQVRFKPAEIDGRPVKSQLRIIVKSDEVPVPPPGVRSSGMQH